MNVNDGLLFADTNGEMYKRSLASITNGMFIQNGNSFGALATLGTNDAFNLSFETAGVTRATFDTTGNFSIGGTPITTARMFVNDSGSSYAATSGAVQGIGHIERLGDASGVVLDTGINGGNGAWLQVTNQGNLAVNYPLMFNPNGGNVGIGLGATTPSQLFHVAGIAGTANIRFNSLSGTGLTTPLLNTTNGLVHADANGDLRKFDVNNPTNGLIMQNGNTFGAAMTIGTNDAQNFNFKTSGATRMTLTAAGNLGLGFAAPTQRLEVNGIIQGGIGAVTTGGTIDWNDVTNSRSGQGYTLLLGTAANGPGSGSYYHPFNFEYSSKDGSGNITQLGVPYSNNISNGIFMRGRQGGTWTSWVKLLQETSTGELQLTGSGNVTTPAYTWNGDTNNGWWRPAADTQAWSTNGLERMRLDNAGNLGIGNTAPGFMLHVGSATVATGTSVARFQNAGGTCTVTPNVAGGVTCTSDIRFKKNITDVDNVSILDLLSQVDIKSYNMLADSNNSQKQIGFIAQNLETVFPSTVITDNEGNKSVSYSAMTPILTAAVKELNIKLDTIENFSQNIDGTDSVFVTRLRAWLASATNGIEDLFTKKVHSEQICLKKSDGSEYCVNGDQLESIMGGAGTSVSGGNTSGGSTGGGSATDTIAPVITLNGDATMTIAVGDTYTESGATATDNVDGDITANVVTSGSVDTTTAGTYTVTYNVNDAAGNNATPVTRTIIVH
jgi:hypothetical protein